MLPTLRTDSAHRALIAAIAVAPLGLLGGLVVYTGLTGMFNHDEGASSLPPDEALLAMALPVMLLSMAAASVAAAERESTRPGRRALATTTIAACACATVTWAPVLIVGYLASGPTSETVLVVVVAMAIVTMLGAIVGFFVGLPFAAAYAALLTLMARARQRSGYAHEPAVWLVVSAAWITAGLLAAPCHDGWRASGLVVAVAGAALGCAALVRVLLLVRWSRRVGRGEVPGYRTVPFADEDAQHPVVVPFFERGAVLVRVADAGEGPFRSHETEHRIARC